MHEPTRIYRLTWVQGVYDFHADASDYPAPVKLYNFLEAHPPGVTLYPNGLPNGPSVPTFIPLQAILRIQDITDHPDLLPGEA